MADNNVSPGQNFLNDDTQLPPRNDETQALRNLKSRFETGEIPNQDQIYQARNTTQYAPAQDYNTATNAVTQQYVDETAVATTKLAKSALDRRTFLATTALAALGGATLWNFYQDSLRSQAPVQADNTNSITGGSTPNSLVINGREYTLDSGLTQGASGIPTSEAVKKYVDGKFIDVAKTVLADKSFYTSFIEQLSKDKNFLEKITLDSASLSTSAKNLKEFVETTDTRLELLEKNSLKKLTSADNTILINGSDIRVNPTQLSALALADGSVNSAKLADGSVTTNKFADGAVTLIKLASNSVDGSKIIDGSVGTAEVADGAITSIKIANGTITGTDIANATITGANIAANTVTGANILDESITNADIADGAISADKLDQMGATSGQVLKWNGTAWAPSADLTGGGGGVTDPGANGFMSRTALNTTIARTITSADTKLTITNGDGTLGNPTLTINEANLTSTEKTANKGVANGYAGLDGTGRVPVAQLPTTLGSATQTSSNGLTTTGTNVALGGTITAATTLGLGNNNFTFNKLNSETGRLVINTNSSGQSGLQLLQLDTLGTATVANSLLGVDAAGVVVKATPVSAINTILPTQTGNSGRYLQTNGTNVSWVTTGSSAWTSGGGIVDLANATDSVRINTGSINPTLELNNTSGANTLKLENNENRIELHHPVRGLSGLITSQNAVSGIKIQAMDTNGDVEIQANGTGDVFTNSPFVVDFNNARFSRDGVQPYTWSQGYTLALSETSVATRHPRLAFHDAGNSEAWMELNDNSFYLNRDQSGGLSLRVKNDISAENGIFISQNATNEGGAISLRNPLKTGTQIANWQFWNMTGGYGDSLQLWRYSGDATISEAALTLYDTGALGFGSSGNTGIAGQVLVSNGPTTQPTWKYRGSTYVGNTSNYAIPGGQISIPITNTAQFGTNTVNFASLPVGSIVKYRVMGVSSGTINLVAGFTFNTNGGGSWRYYDMNASDTEATTRSGLGSFYQSTMYIRTDTGDMQYFIEVELRKHAPNELWGTCYINSNQEPSTPAFRTMRGTVYGIQYFNPGNGPFYLIFNTDYPFPVNFTFRYPTIEIYEA